MNKIYGYCRISTRQQNIERQQRNIRAKYNNAIIVNEVFTGTKTEGRKAFNKLLSNACEGDLIVFDSVSRMSRDGVEGFKLYKRLYEEGVELEFLKEPHINTNTYKKALKGGLELTGTMVDSILKGVNEYLLNLAEEQIKLAFEQSQKEVDDLRQRTKEGIETARLNGQTIGQVKGRKLKVKKSIKAKKEIIKYSERFEGTLKDVEVMKLVGISRNTYYKYKKEIIEEKGGAEMEKEVVGERKKE